MGIVYKISNKKLTLRQAGTAIGKTTSYTKTWEDTAKTILNAFVIRDPHCSDSLAQLKIRRQGRHPLVQTSEPNIPTDGTIDQIINNLKKGKAPGIDLIEADILKAVWPVVGKLYIKLYQACFKVSTFPANWKRGRIHAILKPGNKDRPR